MTKTSEQRLPVAFIWKLMPDSRRAEYYEVYARYPFGQNMTHYAPFPILIGATRGIVTDRIYSLNHPEFSELGTRHFAYEEKTSVEEYLQHEAYPLPISLSSMVEIVEYLKQHKPKGE